MLKFNPFTNKLDIVQDLSNSVTWGGNTLGSKKLIGSIDNQAIGFKTNNDERLTILKNGNVGIGTTNPVVKLTLQQGDQAFTPLWSAPTGNMAFGISANTSSISGMDFKNFNPAGQVRLMARNDNNDYITMNAMGTNASAAFFGQKGDQLLLFGYGKRMAIGTFTSTPLILGTSNKEQMRIDTAGNVGIGTLTPSQKLDVEGNTIRLRQNRTPASSSASGNKGDICWDTNYIYICVATNTWKRTSLETW